MVSSLSFLKSATFVKIKYKHKIIGQVVEW